MTIRGIIQRISFDNPVSAHSHGFQCKGNTPAVALSDKPDKKYLLIKFFNINGRFHLPGFKRLYNIPNKVGYLNYHLYHERPDQQRVKFQSCFTISQLSIFPFTTSNNG